MVGTSHRLTKWYPKLYDEHDYYIELKTKQRLIN